MKPEQYGKTTSMKQDIKDVAAHAPNNQAAHAHTPGPSRRAECARAQDGNGGRLERRHHPSDASSEAKGNGCAPHEGGKPSCGASPETSRIRLNLWKGWVSQTLLSISASQTAREREVIRDHASSMAGRGEEVDEDHQIELEKHQRHLGWGPIMGPQLGLGQLLVFGRSRFLEESAMADEGRR